jgi:pimeloyl-ACP methyl ester carboxylesterase
MADAVHRAGRGSPLVLLHGFTCTWRIWRPVIDHLAAHHEVIALTLPGHRGGPGLPPGVEVSVSSIADGVERVLDAEGVETAHLCGNSLGGWLALELARRGRARSVVALAPAGGWGVGADVRETAKRVRDSARMAGLAAVAAPLVGPSLRIPQVRRALLRMVMERGDRMSAVDAAAMIADAAECSIVDEFAKATNRDGPFVGDMSHVTAPIRVAWSQNDRLLVADTHARPLLDRVTDSDFVVLPGVGHTPMYDDPLLVVATVLEVTLAADSESIASLS